MLFFNEDDTHFFHSRSAKSLPVDEAVLRDFIRQYEGSGITDFLLCVNSRTSATPSAVLESYPQRYADAVKNAPDSPVGQCPWLRLSYHVFYELGIDPYALWVGELRQMCIHPWISFRMNDCHDNNLEDYYESPLLTRHFLERKDLRRVRHRTPTGYFDRCYDYAKYEVRERMLRYMEEQILRYDPYGVETDFQREAALFAPGGEYAGQKILTAFMADVRTLCDKCGAKLGHPVQICAHVQPDYDTCLQWGMDVAAWMENGSIDVLAPSPRWESINTDIPVESWKVLTKRYNVTLLCGTDCQCTPYAGWDWHNPRPLNTNESLNGVSAAALTMGADGMYLFNYFDCQTGPADEPSFRYREMLETLSDREKCVAAPRLHTISYQDMLPAWRPTNAQMLRTILPGTVETLRVRVGQLPDGAEVLLRLGYDGEEAALRAYVNSAPAPFLRKTVPSRFSLLHSAFLYAPKALPEGFAVVELENTGAAPIQVDCAEILVNMTISEQEA